MPQPNNSTLIEMHELTRVYQLGPQEIHALQGIELIVKHGEYVAVMGPSGSGKSTLMNIIGCLDRPTAGKYILDGTPVEAMGDDELAAVRNKKIGFIFQTFNLLPRTTALQNVELPGGQRQRVAIARALVNKPSLLLADEPTGNLDSQTGREILDLFRDLHSSGNSIIMVTHEDDVAREAKRIIHIRDGRVLD